MTNREWIKELNDKTLINLIENNCTMCICNNSADCSGQNCKDGIKEWLNAEHEEKPHNCPICGGEMYMVDETLATGIYHKYHLTCRKCHIRQMPAYTSEYKATCEWNNLFEVNDNDQ